MIFAKRVVVFPFTLMALSFLWVIMLDRRRCSWESFIVLDDCTQLMFSLQTLALALILGDKISLSIFSYPLIALTMGGGGVFDTPQAVSFREEYCVPLSGLLALR